MAGRPPLFQGLVCRRVTLTLPEDSLLRAKQTASQLYRGELSELVHEALEALHREGNALLRLREENVSLDLQRWEAQQEAHQLRSALRRMEIRYLREQGWKRRAKRQLWALRRYMEQHGHSPEEALSGDARLQELEARKPTPLPRGEIYEAVRSRVLSFLGGIGNAGVREKGIQQLCEESGIQATPTMVSYILRSLLRRGEILREGDGKPGKPYLYLSAGGDR